MCNQELFETIQAQHTEKKMVSTISKRKFPWKNPEYKNARYAGVSTGVIDLSNPKDGFLFFFFLGSVFWGFGIAF